MRYGHMLIGAAAIALTVAGCTKGSDNAVLAKVNQTKITAGDFKRQLEGLDNVQLEQAVLNDAKARREFLDDLIGIELVNQEAKRQGLDKEADYKKTLDTLTKDYEDTKRRLERRYQDAKRNELFKVLLKKELAEKAKKLEQPTDQEVKDFYEKNRDKMVTMDGKRLALKDVQPQIKNRLFQEKQRDLYLGYIKGLREKAKVTVDEKAADAVASSMTVSATLQLQQPAAPAEKKDEKKADETKK
jgi:SurA-like N-terminal domain